MTPDTQTRYGTISRLLHWSMALLFVLMLATALAWRWDEAYFSLIGYHKSIGTLLALLLVLRLLWAWTQRKKRPANTLAAKLGHLALYVLMLWVPFVALLRQYGSARGSLDVFGIPVMAGAPEKIQWMMHVGNQWHGTLAWLLFALAGGHIVMALWHQLRGDKVLSRMAGR